MPAPIDRDFQRSFVRALRDRPLNYADRDDRQLWAPLHDAQHDLVDRLFDTVDFAEAESIQLVMGFRGTGKTTEFTRLRARLEAQDFVVIRVDLDEYIDLRHEVAVSDFLMLMSGAIREQLIAQGILEDLDGFEAGFWERTVGFLSQEVELEELGITLPGGVDLKARLKGDQRLRQRLRELLSSRLQALVAEVRALHTQTLEEVKAARPDHKGLVVILDSLEHLRGGGEEREEERIRRSAEDLFLRYGGLVELPNTHLVLSVPASLMLKADELASSFRNGQVQAWTACRVRHPDGTPNTDAIARMRALVDKRGEWRRVLGDERSLDELILASGGYIRDLLNMLVEATHLAATVPPSEAAGKAISRTRNAYSAVLREERDLLARIASTRDLSLVSTAEMGMVENFLDSHLLLPYRNDTFWYDVHPMVAPSVARGPSGQEE